MSVPECCERIESAYDDVSYNLARSLSNNNNKNKHYSICKALGIATADKWYTHMPKPVYEEGDVTVLWNQDTQTEKLQQIGQI